MADILENPVDLIDDAYEQEIQVEQEPIEVVAYRSYNQLDDKPQINGVELVGNKTSSDLGITAQINSAVNSEAQTRQQADNALQGEIDAEELARQQADSTLQGKIDAEETARKAADKDIQDVLDGETLARQNADTALGGRIDTEIHDRQVADIGLQGQIDAITSKSDVVDVVATYAALQAYDTQHLGDNDVIKVLDDETHGDALTYYRWSKTNQTWSYIGQEAPYYSKSQTDTLLLGKQDKIDSTHKLSADLVDDTNATNKFVTAEDKTNWDAKQNALTAGTGIDIENGVVSTPAIVPEIVSELPTTGSEGKLYLTPKNYTRGTGTGNPVTATITDEAGKMDSFKLDGDTYQQTYSGKNLIGAVEQSYGSYGIANTLEPDGAIKCSGKCEQTYFQITRQTVDSGVASATPCNIPAGNYTLSIVSPTNAMNIVLRLYYSTSASDYSQFTLSKGNQSVSVAITSPAVMFYIWGGGTTLGQEIDTTIKLQLESGSTATIFERFTGGQPSPNPSYLQPIQTVTGEQTIRICGRNIYDKSKDLVGYALTGDGVETALAAWHVSDYIPIVGGETYVVTGMTTPGGTAKTCYYDSAKNLIEAVSQQTSPYTITPPSGSAYVRLSIFNNATQQILNSDTLQIELGSTAHNYEAYSGTDYPLNLGKNLFDYASANAKVGYILNDSGVEITDNSGGYTRNYSSVVPNSDYILSGLDTISGKTRRVYFYDSNKQFLSRTAPITTGSSKLTFTTPANCYFVNIQMFTPNDTDMSTWQLEAGSTATTYAAYKTPIELCKLGGYQDYIWKDGNTWKVHKATGKYIFETASGTGANWEASSHRVYFTVNYQNAHSITFAEYTDTTTQAPLLADKFKAISFDDLYVNGKSGIALSSTKTLSIRNNSWTDETTARNEITGTTMRYALASATDTAITDTDLIAQLEAIRTASLENGTNTISNSTLAPNLAGDMEVGYYGYNPRNRYDKFIWLNLNNNYEQIGE